MSTPHDFETMTDAELADYQYAHRDAPLGDDADLEEVRVEVARPLSVSMSFRLPPVEASAIRHAAAQAGLSVSDWIRSTCSAALSTRAPDPPVPAPRVKLTKARRLASELEKELSRLVESNDRAGRRAGTKEAQDRRAE